MSAQSNEPQAEQGKAHEVTIIVNGRKRPVEEKDISFEDVVELAYPGTPTGPNIVYTVAYRKAAGNRSGDLLAGQSVKVKEGTIFDVTQTDKS
ncbi:MAG TPA: hypothetical protein DEV93_14525 [Chloroflexi bacterium]|nr:hypothetical protein [Chloroflexota bacterium]